MKKYLTTGIILFMISLILFIDALNLHYRIVNGVGDGTGLYLFFGILEINDTISYSIAPNYRYPLYLIAGLLFAGAMYFMYKAIKLRKLGF